MKGRKARTAYKMNIIVSVISPKEKRTPQEMKPPSLFCSLFVEQLFFFFLVIFFFSTEEK